MKPQAGSGNSGANTKNQRPTSKGSTASGSRYKNAGAKDRKLGYGGEKYPTQAQVKKARRMGKKK